MTCCRHGVDERTACSQCFAENGFQIVFLTSLLTEALKDFDAQVEIEELERIYQL